MNHKDFQCRHCFHADIHVISVIRGASATSWLGKEMNQLSIYCKKKRHNILYPYEQCKHRQETPKLTIHAY